VLYLNFHYTLTENPFFHILITEFCIFGFYRYSTASTWFLPHFEKLLYHQALMAMTYTEAYQATGLEKYKIMKEKISEYALKDLTSEKVLSIQLKMLIVKRKKG
jgi:uncharacterized protein YyaL (SSP411 family)